MLWAETLIIMPARTLTSLVITVPIKMKKRWTSKKAGGDGGVATVFLDALDLGSLGSGGFMSSNISLTGSRCSNVRKGSNERVIAVVMSGGDGGENGIGTSKESIYFI